eukprot:11955632-Alexandrium_andersonii.AAC.1
MQVAPATVALANGFINRPGSKRPLRMQQHFQSACQECWGAAEQLLATFANCQDVPGKAVLDSWYNELQKTFSDELVQAMSFTRA